MQKTRWKSWLVYAGWIITVLAIMLLVWIYFAKRISQINENNL